jgi:hypothetical protein
MLLRPYSVSVVVLFPLFIVAILLARAVGGGQPLHPALEGFASCAAAAQCWHGIAPAVTPIEEAQRLVIALGYRHGDSNQDGDTYRAPAGSAWCDVRINHFGSAVVRNIFLSCRAAQIRIGDMMALVGAPERMDIDYMFAMLRNPERGLAYRVQTWSSPYELVDTIDLSLPYVLSNHPHIWHGFISKADYCRLEPGSAGC